MIRIVADRSKDSHGGGHFAELVPGGEFACTDNRRRLTRSLLGKYDVLAICGESLKPYTAAELAAIREFVEAGGGLVLAASAPAFELEANAPVERMSQNAVAGLFEAAFLSADCKGAKVDPSLQIGFPPQRVGARSRALGDAALGLVTEISGPIVTPPGAEVLAAHRATRQPVAAAFRHGEGRVVMVGVSAFCRQRPMTCTALAEWLAPAAGSRRGGRTVPRDYLGRRGGVKRGDHFHLTYDQSCAGEVDATISLLERVNDVCKRRFGAAGRAPRQATLADALRSPHDPGVGAQAPAGSRARQLLCSLLRCGVGRWESHECLAAVFSDAPWQIHLATDLLGELGEDDEAARCRERADRWLAEMDRRARVFDLARNYTATRESCPRGLVVLRELVADHGKGAIPGLATALPEKDPFKHLPASYAWPSDRAIYYLSLAVGKDLFPWFAERGLTVHRLPLARPDARNCRRRMLARLREALRDDAESLSSRMDAALDLAAMSSGNDDGRRDAWSALCRALRLAKQADARAGAQLRKLFAKRRPPELRAIAGLALADLGDASVGGELVRLARRFDPRFQLAAGYALDKAGSEWAEQLSFENLRDADGNRAGELDIRFHRELQLHCKVEGYRVNNICSLPARQLFTPDTAVSALDVYWVHTSPVWRRCGLSRYTMAKTMSHPAAMRCSCSGLGTGTRNVAHRLYRDFGFTDMGPGEQWICDLSGSTPGRLPTRVAFREYAEGDGPRIAAFHREQRGAAMNADGLPRGELSPRELGFLAEREGKLVGYITGREPEDDRASIGRLVLARDDQRESIADALIALLHRKVWELGAKRMEGWQVTEDKETLAALNRVGYQAKLTGGVWMMQVRNLAQFLGEISPVIEKRLADSEFKAWQGAIDLIADRLRARVSVAKGKVKVSTPRPLPAGIVLRCDDDAATRIALGRETPFQAYLQARLEIAPRITDQVVKLLETVFPYVETH